MSETPLDQARTERLDAIVEAALSAILEASEGWEFDSFLVALKRVGHEPDEAAYVKRNVGLRLYERWQHLGRDCEFKRPDIVFEIRGLDLNWQGEIRIKRRPRAVYLFGRYTKLKRGLSQSQWLCQKCHGKGCKRCEDKGRYYQQSVQELLSEVLSPAFGSAKLADFHGMGREDVDVLMLGQGRPFVLEIFLPKKRKSVDLEALAEDLNRRQQGLVGVRDLTLLGLGSPGQVKETVADKSYRAWCRYTDGSPEPTKVQELEATFKDRLIEQRTPQRVSKRRANKIRPRTVRHLILEEAREDGCVFEIRAQSGTYIKELISGDDGRTQPNIADFLGVPCVCEQLDVLDIHISSQDILSRTGLTKS